MSGRRNSRCPQGSVQQQGFTLLELTVALAISATILILVLELLDLNQRVGQVQTDLATVQQAERSVHSLLSDRIRMTGRGGLPLALSLSVANNVADDYEIAGNPTVDGTDVLRLRGVFTGLYLVDTNNLNAFDYDDVANTGTVILDSLIPTRIGRQPLDALEDALADNRPVPVILRSSTNNNTYAVVEMRPTSTVVATDVNGDGSVEAWEKRATIRFSTATNVGTHNEAYLNLSSTPGVWPATMTRVGSVGILQEFRYYVRDGNTAVDGNRPSLSRAEVYPGTNPEVVVGDAANGRIDIADNVLDLQIERGFDVDLDLILDEDFDELDADEWLGNSPDDTYPAVVGLPVTLEHVPTFTAAGWDFGVMTHVAFTTLVGTDRPSIRYVAPAIDALADHDYDEDDSPTDDELIERRFRRRQLRSVVDLRNL